MPDPAGQYVRPAEQQLLAALAHAQAADSQAPSAGVPAPAQPAAAHQQQHAEQAAGSSQPQPDARPAPGSDPGDRRLSEPSASECPAAGQLASSHPQQLPSLQTPAPSALPAAGTVPHSPAATSTSSLSEGLVRDVLQELQAASSWCALPSRAMQPCDRDGETAQLCCSSFSEPIVLRRVCCKHRGSLRASQLSTACLTGCRMRATPPAQAPGAELSQSSSLESANQTVANLQTLLTGLVPLEHTHAPRCACLPCCSCLGSLHDLLCLSPF